MILEIYRPKKSFNMESNSNFFSSVRIGAASVIGTGMQTMLEIPLFYRNWRSWSFARVATQVSRLAPPLG
jgi:hypothetical protein